MTGLRCLLIHTMALANFSCEAKRKKGGIENEEYSSLT
jgi:hypothetical protein